MVYVKSIDGKALMPTSNAKARKLLKQQKAKVLNVKPFVIQLTYRTETEYVQKIELGIDSGYANIGFSAIDEEKEYIAGEVKLLTGMKEYLKNHLIEDVGETDFVIENQDGIIELERRKKDGYHLP